MGAALTAAERTRRAVAATVAETAQNRAAAEVLAVTAAGAGAGAGAPRPGPLPASGEREAEGPPRITITIAGPPGSGKSVVAHLVRDRLAHEGIACRGPDGLRSIAWRRAVAELIGRGIAVELIKVETTGAAAEGSAR